MPQEGSRKILFVVNPGSGGRTKVEWETEIINYFSSLPFVIELFVVGDGASLDQAIDRFDPWSVVAVGGDGTVSMVAKELVGTERVLGILPAGSANGMAKELGISEQANLAMEVIAQGNVRKADVIKVNDEHVCLHLSDIGLNAKLIKHFEEGKLRGKWGYASKVLKTLWTKKTMKVSIQLEDRVVHHAALMIVLANATKYGTGAVINPHGDLYDGKFEVVIMRRLAVSELLKMWFRPQPFDPKKIRVFPATSVTINTKRKVHFQVDGEYLGKVQQVNAEIMPSVLKLLVP